MTGAVFLAMGMCWGIAMAISQNFALAPAHAHLNLLGWVTMSIYGGFYALTRETMSPRLAWINYSCATLGVAIMITALGEVTIGDLGAFPAMWVASAVTTMLAVAVCVVVSEPVRSEGAL